MFPSQTRTCVSLVYFLFFILLFTPPSGFLSYFFSLPRGNTTSNCIHCSLLQLVACGSMKRIRARRPPSPPSSPPPTSIRPSDDGGEKKIKRFDFIFGKNPRTAPHFTTPLPQTSLFPALLAAFCFLRKRKKKREREGNETPEPASDLKVLICLAIAKCQFPPWK